jgi:hypothetical protein
VGVVVAEQVTTTLVTSPDATAPEPPEVTEQFSPAGDAWTDTE